MFLDSNFIRAKKLIHAQTAVASTSVTAPVSSHPEVAGEKEKKKFSKEKKRKQLADDGSTTPKSKKAKAAPVEENSA